MTLDPWAFDTQAPFWLPTHIWGYLLVATYLLVLVAAARPDAKNWYRLLRDHAAGMLAALLLGGLASGLFLIRFPLPEVPPLPNLPDVPVAPAVPLFGAVTILLIGGWLGTGPAILVGAVSGAVRGVWLTGRGLQGLEVALAAGLAAWLIQQRYQGRSYSWLRRPLVAAPVAGLASVLLAMLSVICSAPESALGLPALSYGWSMAAANLAPSLVEWTVAGVIVDIVFDRLPVTRTGPAGLILPPWDRSITGRFLWFQVPLFLAVIIGSLAAVTAITVDKATDWYLNEMARDARTASLTIPENETSCRSLLAELSRERVLVAAVVDDELRTVEPEFSLQSALRNSACYRQIIVYDAAGEVVDSYPPGEETRMPMLADEEVARDETLASGQVRSALGWAGAGNLPIMTQVEPIKDSGDRLVGALLGRMDLSVTLGSVAAGLQQTLGTGRGFIADEQGRIITRDPDEGAAARWVPEDGQKATNLDPRLSDDSGHAYLGTGSDGSRQLIYYRSGDGHPWTVVVMVPYSEVLTLAAKVNTPLAAILLVAGGALAAGLVFLTRGVIRPLSSLAQAAGAIAERNIDTPVRVTGEDEVGRLAGEIETMRRALNARISELQLLLGVSRSVASSLSLPHGLPSILDGALEATGADGVRVLALASRERGPLILGKGDLSKAMSRLDLAIARLLRQNPLLRVEDMNQVRALVSARQLTEPIGAILALPLRTAQRYQGVLWIAYRGPHAFRRSEISFMTTLASQATMLVQNVQLYEAAEGGRRRLAAILSSTSDAVIVTDPQNRILLLNPAAESAFGVLADRATGQPVAEVLDHAELLTMLTGTEGRPTGELSLPGGRVLYANISSISGEQRQMLGRVAVLRDITQLKELDEMKSEFVNTVSHDLRNPLTYVRGYVTMLPLVGEMTAKQAEYLDKVLVGIDQMTVLVENVLDLANIGSDPEDILHPVQIAPTIVSTAEGFRSRAESKGLSFVVDVEENLPVVLAEPNLLGQAVTNLIDNAIKYTQHGSVFVRARADQNEVVVQVQDTGPGISPPDQTRLFEKFYRIRRRDAPNVKGSGLGLSIVKSIVERRHHGRVWVDSQLGIGSSFYIALPKVEDQVA